MTFIYDSVHYPAIPHHPTRPEHLEMVGWLFGMSPRRAHEARVLEIGCSVGGNLLPMAERFPGATFVGIDLSASQIAVGQKIIDELGLGNVELRALDLTLLDESFGQFDYIIAHGLYSWVPESVRERLLAVVKERLAPQGVALVSHNVKPGWHLKAMARDMMLYHSRDVADPLEKVQKGRAFLETLTRHASPSAKAYHAVLAEQVAQRAQIPDQALLHDDFADVCDGIYFHELAARLAANQLQYLGDAHPWLMWPTGLSPQSQAFLESVSGNIIEREQYLDFLKNRVFRHTLICHAGLPLNHNLSVPQVTHLWISSSVRPEPREIDVHDRKEVVFKNNVAGARITEALSKAAFLELGEQWPLPLEFGELCLRAYHRVGGPYEPRWIAVLLAGELLKCYLNRVVDFSVGEPRFVTRPGERPRTTALIRWQARTGGSIVALRHILAEIDGEHRQLLALLDGNRDRAALAAEIKRTVKQVDKMLVTLAQMSLIAE